MGLSRVGSKLRVKVIHSGRIRLCVTGETQVKEVDLLLLLLLWTTLDYVRFGNLLSDGVCHLRLISNL